MLVTHITCISPEQIAHALIASWSGNNVLVTYAGIDYPLYTEWQGEAIHHLALMQILAPSIAAADNVELQLSKADRAISRLTIDWQRWSTYPVIEIK